MDQNKKKVDTDESIDSLFTPTAQAMLEGVEKYLAELSGPASPPRKVPTNDRFGSSIQKSKLNHRA
jgi:hypothetical protein